MTPWKSLHSSRKSVGTYQILLAPSFSGGRLMEREKGNRWICRYYTMSESVLVTQYSEKLIESMKKTRITRAITK